MINDISNYFVKEDLNSPALMCDIEEAQESFETRFPNQYKSFMLLSSGYDGMIGEAYVSIWKIEDLIELNVAYEVREYAPHLILFASDGGGEAYAFNRKNDMQVVNIPFTGMGLEGEKVIASTFNEFIEKLYSGIV